MDLINQSVKNLNRDFFSLSLTTAQISARKKEVERHVNQYNKNAKRPFTLVFKAKA